MAAPVNPQWANWVCSPKDLGAHASVAGFRGSDIPLAVAVALAESGGKAYAVGGPNDDGTYDYGCWQINEGAHKQLFAGNADWSNPQTNARMAFAVYTEAGNSWRPWTVFKSGAYKKYENAYVDGVVDSLPGDPSPLGLAQDAAEGLAEATGLDAVGQSINNIGELVYKAGAWLGDSDNWVRVAQVVVGGGLLIASLAIIARPAVGAVAPVGKLVKGLTK